MKNSKKICIYFDKFVHNMTEKIKLEFTANKAFYFDEL